MKKRVITKISALIIAIACAFALTACGGGDPKKIKSDVVTAEQWADAFKAENFKNVKIESTVTDESPYLNEDGSSEDTKTTFKSTVIIADGIQYYKSEATVEKGPQVLKDLAKEYTFERYSSESNGKYTTYYKNKDGNWRQYPSEAGVADDLIKGFVEIGKKYNEFEHQDGWVKGYWLKENPSGVSPRSYKFKKGKLVAVCTYEEGESTTFEYGKQKLTVPTPEDSSYAGKWKTHQLILGANTYNVDAVIPEMGNYTLPATFVTVDLKNDGTATFTNPNGTGEGIWMETVDGITAKTKDERYNIEIDGTYLKIQVDSDMTVVLKKE